MPTLKIITGPMYAGKTTELIKTKRMIQAESSVFNFLMINHMLDDRYTEHSFITSHNKESEMCTKTNDLTSLLYTKEFKNATHVFIDEAQFFDKCDLVRFTEACLFTENKNIIVAGLNSNISMGDIGGIHLLFKFADEIKILKGECSYCDGNSCANIIEGRKTDMFSDADTIDLTKLNNYIFKPVCRDCWFLKSKK